MTAKRKITPEIKKRLLFGEVLASSLQQKKKQCGKKGSQIVASVAASALLRKYNMIGSAQSIFGYKMFSQVVGSHHFQRTRKQMVRGGRIKEAKQVQNFLEKDQNSRMCPGKKDHKKKTQKRHLLYIMKELHKKYKDRFKSTISYSTFLRLRPCWIIQPRVTDRSTCVCAKHANMQFIVTKLHELKLIPFFDAEKLCAALCCDKNRRECMYRLCDECHDKVITKPIPNGEEEDQVSYFQWKRKTESML